MKIFLITALFFFSANLSYAQDYYSSYNDRYYGYGVPLEPNIKTPKKWGQIGPRLHPDHYYQFGYRNQYDNRNHWFIFRYVIEY